MRTTITVTIVFGLAVASLSLAQTSTATLYVPGADPQPLEASIITSDGSATTYLLQCIPGTDSNDCGFEGAVTLTEGPKTAAYTFGPYSDDNGTLLFTGYFDCSLDGTTSAVCVESAGGSEANSPGMSTVTYTGTDMPYIPVVVTAQAAGTGGSVAASTTASTSTKTDGVTSATGSTSGSGGSVAQTTASTSSSSMNAASSSSTAGGAVVTGKTGWLVGGAAAALAMMA